MRVCFERLVSRSTILLRCVRARGHVGRSIAERRKNPSTFVPSRRVFPPKCTNTHAHARKLLLLLFFFLSRKALAEAAERARELQMFLAMAPEGTRTKTGQLGPFKKVSKHAQETSDRLTEYRVVSPEGSSVKACAPERCLHLRRNDGVLNRSSFHL